MRAVTVERIETGVQRAAAAAFAGAVAFAVFQLLARVAEQPGLGVFTAASALVAYLVCGRILAGVDAPSARFPVRAFDVAAIEAAEPQELPEADSERAAEDALVLDDILAEIGPDSRVVRLFDPAAMPTPGQLQARIDRHLDEDDAVAPLADASQALYEALDELRRSLR